MNRGDRSAIATTAAQRCQHPIIRLVTGGFRQAEGLLFDSRGSRSIYFIGSGAR